MLDGGEWTLWEFSSHLTAVRTPTGFVRVVKTTTMKGTGKQISAVIDVMPKDKYWEYRDLKKDSPDFGTFSVEYHAERMDNQGNWENVRASTPAACISV